MTKNIKRELIITGAILFLIGALVVLLLVGCGMDEVQKETRRIELRQQADDFLSRAAEYQRAQERIAICLQVEKDPAIRGRLLEAINTLQQARLSCLQANNNCWREANRL